MLQLLILYLFSPLYSEDNKFLVKEFDISYHNIPNQNGFNNLLTISNRSYDMYYDKFGTYFYIEGETSLLRDNNEYHYSFGGLFGLKTIFIPENNEIYPIKYDLNLCVGFFTLSSQSYSEGFRWLPEHIGIKVGTSVILKYKRVGLVFGYNEFFDLPFRRSFSIGFNIRLIEAKSF